MPGLLDHFKAHIPAYIVTDEESKRAPRRLGFDLGFAFHNHTYVWVNQRGLFLVEHTGAGCDDLTARGLLWQVIQKNVKNVTRIDIATDILCDVRPLAFISKRTEEKTEARSHIQSPSGETCYIGSQKSERSCRVYRYDGKHPRAGFLRIEYVYRREDAKACAFSLMTQGIEKTALSSADRYGWKHEVWQLSKNANFRRDKGV